MKSPAFQFYPSDFIVGVMGMSDDEVGIYIKMLAFQWVKGGLPIEPTAIKKLIGSRKIPSDAVMEKFALCEDGLLRNDRLEIERDKQASFRESRSENARKRWKKESTSNARASGSTCTVHNGSNALQSSSSSSDSPLPPEGGDGDLVSIASLYPRRSHQRETLEAIQHVIGQGHTLESIRIGTAAIAEKLKTWPSGELNRYTPTPPKFFRELRFLDDPATWVRETEKKQAWKDDPTHRPY